MTSSSSPSVVDALEGALEWRCIGPYRAGRVIAVAGDPGDPRVFYFGSVGGGVWKSTDGGAYWQNVSDGFLNTASVGAIAVAQSDPNVVYAGMGETCIRIDLTHGDGVYRSDDAGATWTHLGLDDTRHISRVRVHPGDPGLVYVSAFGHAFGPSAQRGIFRSKDGGRSWQNILYKSEDAGAADLSMDPNNPRILYASMWEARRSFWAMNSGGPGSGLYRSTDGGDTWDEITRRPGLPEGVVGRIGVAVSPARTGRVWALVEAEDGGLFRSDDGGESWQKVNDTEDVRSRPWYYTHVFADPASPDTVYVLAPKTLRSTDGGRTFEQVNMPHSDQHDLWIDPSDPRRMIEGNDGGACVTYDGGDTWSSIYNQPTSQLYSVVADNQTPYRVYGAQQDNSAVSVPSRSVKGVIPWNDCYTIGLSESGKVAVKPTDPNVVYSSYPGGTLLRYDHRSGQVRVIMVWPEYFQNSPPKVHRYRFGWEFPITISPHDPDTLYAAGNVAFKSTDEGTTWEAISPRPDAKRPREAGAVRPHHLRGPVGGDLLHHIRLRRVSPGARSPLGGHRRRPRARVEGRRRDLERRHARQPAGVDDGELHRAVTPRRGHGLRRGYQVQARRQPPLPIQDERLWLHLDPHRRRHPRRRLHPRPQGGPGPARAPVRGYGGPACTPRPTTEEAGPGCSSTCPSSPVYDLEVKDGDLVAATHGRSFWVLDDLTPLRQAASDTPTGTHLFEPRPAIRFMKQLGSIVESGPGKHYTSDILGAPASWVETTDTNGRTTRKGLDSGVNPPEGAAHRLSPGTTPRSARSQSRYLTPTARSSGVSPPAGRARTS